MSITTVHGSLINATLPFNINKIYFIIIILSFCKFSEIIFNRANVTIVDWAWGKNGLLYYENILEKIMIFH